MVGCWIGKGEKKNEKEKNCQKKHVYLLIELKYENVWMTEMRIKKWKKEKKNECEGEKNF